MGKTSIIFLAVPPTLREKIPHRHIDYDGSGSSSGTDDPDADDTENGESFTEDLFEIDPSIPIPAEYENDEGSLDLEKLSWEMILSGMLKIISVKGRSLPGHSTAVNGTARGKKKPIKSGDIAADVEKADIPHEWVEYYRNFVLAVKPEIYHEFTDATIVKTENGDFDTALEISAVLEGLFPNSPGVLLNKALILENRAEFLGKKHQNAEKENREALEAYETTLNQEPVLPDALFNAGFFYVQQKDFSRARDCFTRYLEAAEDPDSFSEEQEGPMGFTAEKLEQAKKIIKDIDEEGLDDSSFQEAYACVNSGKDEEGLVKIRDFIERRPTVWNGWFVLGWALRKQGRFGDGLEALKKAAELGGTNSDVLNETAICLMELGDFKGAKKELERALRRESENTKIISNLGVLALKTGKQDEAAAFFRAVLELDPEDPLATHYLEKT